MNGKRKWIMVAIAVLGLSGAVYGKYWEWGWGSYGVGSVEDVARFDWSCVNFGNIPESQATVERCNAILKLNPNHKFLLRLWPVGGQGKVLRNASVFDYHYAPGVREKVLARLESQVKLIRDNISNPDAICALTFCEELPGHVSTFDIMRRAGQQNEQADFREMAPYREQVRAELGEDFNASKEDHMRFWGKKFVSMLDEAHRLMKKLCPGARVIYWQATGYRTIDMAGKYGPGILPFSVGDILGPDRCDGVFAYPNSQRTWNAEAVEMLKRYNCVVFSQISTPSYMRLEQFDKTVETARWEHPGNLGTFLYAGREPRPTAFNAIEASKEVETWRDIDYQNRWFGWKYGVGKEIVEKALAPDMEIIYDLTGKKSGDIVNISVQILNRRSASWFGGDAGMVEIEPQAELILPDCLKLMVDNSIPLNVSAGKMGGEDVKVINAWYARVAGDIPENVSVSVRVSGKNIPGTVEARASGVRSVPDIFQSHQLSKLHTKWLVPDGKTPATGGVEIRPVGNRALREPGVKSAGRECVYRGTLGEDEILRIRGTRGEIVPGSLFSENILKFNRAPGEKLESGAEDYLLFSTPSVSFRPGAEYTLELNGQCGEDGTAHVLAEFTGKKDGKPFKKSENIIYSNLKDGSAVKTFNAPEAGLEPGSERMLFRFYRAKRQGRVALDSFNLLRRAEAKDVSGALKGALPPLAAPVYWEYFDADPMPSLYREMTAPIVSVRFLKPGE
jgi:hypothetical protein